MTRAKEKLYLTCAQQRMLFGRTSNNRPSRFVEEIPQELLERTGRANRWDSDSWGGGIPSRDSGYGGYDRPAPAGQSAQGRSAGYGSSPSFIIFALRCPAQLQSDYKSLRYP